MPRPPLLVLALLAAHPAGAASLAQRLDAVYPLAEACILVPPLPMEGVLDVPPAEAAALKADWRLARRIDGERREAAETLVPPALDPTEGLDRKAIEDGGEPLRAVIRPLFRLFLAWWHGLKPNGPGLPPLALQPLHRACPAGVVLAATAEGERVRATFWSLLSGGRLAEGEAPLGR